MDGPFRMAQSDDPATDQTLPERARLALARGISIGRYLLLDALGEGGMGVVYKAYDPELGRPIALKLLRTEDQATHLQERLLREAQALARLSHPNVVAVHDVGLHDGNVFIAMEFVEGPNGRRWLDAQPRTPREMLELFLAAGEGLAAAHRAGLVHRDFKPDNVIVGDDGRVRVLDFGLARAATASTLDGSSPSATSARSAVMVDDTATVSGHAAAGKKRAAPEEATPHPVSSSGLTPLLATPLTHIGAIVGTPRFMAPEQLLGEPTGEAADQFSFCVSLYWALYRSYPFRGREVEDLLEQIQRQELLPPPEGSKVPRWLRAVLERGLASRADARFPSMAALLAALRADPAERRRRWLRGALVGASILALAGGTVAGVVAYRARRGAAEQAHLAQRFGQEVEKISAIARYSALLPLHDSRHEMDLIRKRMERVRGQMHALGSLAQGPGHHALARGHIALEQYEEALAELNAATATGYVTRELHYALGLVHGKLYQRALAALKKTNDAKLDAARRAEIARAHRDPALRYLRLAAAHDDQDPLDGEAPEYGEGLIALYEQRFDEALKLARKAADGVSWLFEARELEGDIYYLAGKEREFKGEVDAAVDQYKRAGDAYRAAIKMGHSSFAALLGECNELIEIASVETERDQSPQETVKRVLAACGDAATVRPDSPVPLVTEGRAFSALGAHQANHGADPTEAQGAAIRVGQRALELDGRNPAAHEIVGHAQRQLAEYAMKRSEDPRPLLAQAIEHAQRALAVDANDVSALSLLLRAWESRADYEYSRGLDPSESLRRAVDAGERGLALEPNEFNLWNSLGMAFWDTARWERDHGYDSSGAIHRAENALEKVLQLSPSFDYGHTNLCGLYQEEAELKMQIGADPRSRIEQAFTHCEKALALDERDVTTHFNVGLLHLSRARLLFDEGVDPTRELDAARAALERAQRIDPQGAIVFILAKSWVVEGRWSAKRGRDAAAAFARAEALAKRGLSLTERKDPDALRALAEVHRARAEWHVTRHLDPDADVHAGLALIARAFAENPNHADSAETEGALHLAAARAARTSEARIEAAERARRSLERALAINANLEHEVRPLLAETTQLATR
jgi:serine/threonine protein kinase